jgi:hypothetical protein
MSDPVPGWTVAGITHTVRFNTATPNVGPIEGFDVAFTTTSGISGSVFVPAGQVADSKRVAAAVQKRVEELHNIHTLSG